MVLHGSSGGVVCLTFDDAHYREWLKVLPLFREYHAHATFFYSGAVTPEALDSMRLLTAEGHSVGLHTLNHKDAVPHLEEMGAEAYIREQILPQLEPVRKAGLSLSSFAYPNNRRNEKTDAALSAFFRRFRAGSPEGRDQAFQLPDTVGSEPVMHGLGIGEYYHTTLDQLTEDLEKCHRENRILTYFSHGIYPQAPHIHMPQETLVFLLEKAASLGILAEGFDVL